MKKIKFKWQLYRESNDHINASKEIITTYDLIKYLLFKKKNEYITIENFTKY